MACPGWTVMAVSPSVRAQPGDQAAMLMGRGLLLLAVKRFGPSHVTRTPDGRRRFWYRYRSPIRRTSRRPSEVMGNPASTCETFQAARASALIGVFRLAVSMSGPLK